MLLIKGISKNMHVHCMDLNDCADMYTQILLSFSICMSLKLALSHLA